MAEATFDTSPRAAGQGFLQGHGGRLGARSRSWDDHRVATLFGSYLRVYEPLSAFDRESQSYWRRYVHDGRAVPATEGPRRQRAAVLTALGPAGSRLPELPDEAYVLQVDDLTLICPWNLRLRVAQAALRGREEVPPALADLFVSPALTGLARSVVSSAPHRGPHPHEQIAAGEVPHQWFALVDFTERELVLDADRRVLRYRTEISKARRRAHRALSVLRRQLGEVPLAVEVETTARWLEEFHPRSIVELDYGGLTMMIPDEGLRSDNSPQMVADALAALAQGDTDAATSAYEKLLDQRRIVQLLGLCN